MPYFGIAWTSCAPAALASRCPRGRRHTPLRGPYGKADPKTYAATMRSDRDLKLSGYDVFRFGAVELQDRSSAREVLQRFFADLFRSLNLEVSVNGDSISEG
jgi:hypothetical protein